MGEFKSPQALARLHVHRVEVDGVVHEVVSNVSLADMRRMKLGLAWLRRLARSHGRPVQDGASLPRRMAGSRVTRYRRVPYMTATTGRGTTW
jgi:hypothetical protein